MSHHYIVCDFVTCAITIPVANALHYATSPGLSGFQYKLRWGVYPWRYRCFQVSNIYHIILVWLASCECKSIKDLAPSSPQRGSANHLATKHVDVELK